MASYYTTIDQLDARVGEIDSLIDEGNLVELAHLSNGLNLEQMHSNAVANLKGLLGCLGYTITDETDLNGIMAELNQRIQEFHSTTMDFNGELLRQRIIDPLKQMVSDSEAKEIVKFRKLLKSRDVIEEIENVVDKLTDSIGVQLGINLEDYTDEEVDFVAQAIVNSIKNLTIDLTTGSIYGYSSLMDIEIGPKLEKKIAQAIADGGTSRWAEVLSAANGAVANRLLILAQQENIPVDSLFPASTKNLIDTKITTGANGNTASIYFNIYENIPELNNITTEKQARDYFDRLKNSNNAADIAKYKELVEQLVENATNFSMEHFNASHLAPARRDILTQRFKAAIRNIIVNYPASLFMGQNTQGVIGILGEIQGLYYVYSIMGDNNPSIDPATIAKWIGGDTTAGSGAKTGADIILETIGKHTGYGIQVKNSMDELGSTSFSDFVLKEGGENAFYSQLIKFGIDPNIVAAIEDVFIMRGFNIGYRYSGVEPVAGNPKGPYAGLYHSDYGKIMELVERAQRFMALAAAMIMRIQYLEGINYTESNTLWIIGGTAVISAAQILNDLIDQIHNVENSNAFKTSSSTYVNKANFTIVDYLSQNAKSTKGLKTVLRTSYNFHKTTSRVTR